MRTKELLRDIGACIGVFCRLPAPLTLGQDKMHATPHKQSQQAADCLSSQRSGACHTPQECATMVDAVEQAMQHAQECTPGMPALLWPTAAADAPQHFYNPMTEIYKAN